jgi:hypothetical protein
MQTPPIRRLCVAFLGLLALVGGGCSDDDDVTPVGSAQYQRVYYWANVLKKYPDLPNKLDAVIRQREEGAPRQDTSYDDRLPGVQIVVHSGRERHVLSAETVDVIVTDMSTTDLKDLREELRGITSKAVELGIVPTATPAFGQTDRVIVLGSKGTIEINGPNGSSKQSVSVFHAQDTGHLFLSVHAFGDLGKDTLGRLLKDYTPWSPRGPPDDLMGGTRSPRPPPDDIRPRGELKSSLSTLFDTQGADTSLVKRKLTIVVIGEVDTYRVRGASDFSQQTVNFCSFINSYDSNNDRNQEAQETAHFAYSAADHYKDYLRDHGYKNRDTASGERAGAHDRTGSTERPSYERPSYERPVYRPPTARPRPGR